VVSGESRGKSNALGRSSGQNDYQQGGMT